MENNEVFETLEETTNETEEVVNEEEEVEETEDDETSEETGEGLGKLVIVGAGLAAAGAVYGLVKCVKWVGKKATEKARQHKMKKENKEVLDKVEETLVKDAETEPMDVDVPQFHPIDAD